ncbi:MAG: hypothetical protein ACRYFV_15470 [Janthinobacterium lividum]
MNIVSEKLSTVHMRYEQHYRESIIERYSEARGKVNNRPTFSQFWQCYAWAAVLGFINNRRRALIAPTSTSFMFGTIVANGPLVYKALLCSAIAKSEEGIDVLRNPKDLITIIEEYANGGFDLIADTLEEKGKFHFDDFGKMIMEVMNRS